MTRFAEVVHHEWIAAAPAQVRAQFADLDHHVQANVHPKLRFEVLERCPDGARFEPKVFEGRAGTEVAITIRLPLPPVIGPLIEPVLRWQVRKEVQAAAREDKFDLEQRGYPIAVAGLAAA